MFKWRPIIFLFLLISWTDLSKVRVSLASSPTFLLPTLNDQTIQIDDLKDYPILLIVSPSKESVSVSVQLYQRLYALYPNKTYLLIAPNVSFLVPNQLTVSLLDLNVPKSAQSHVILDWNQKLAKFLLVHESDYPMILFMETHQLTLARYRFLSVSDALAFVKEMLEDQL